MNHMVIEDNVSLLHNYLDSLQTFLFTFVPHFNLFVWDICVWLVDFVRYSIAKFFFFNFSYFFTPKMSKLRLIDEFKARLRHLFSNLKFTIKSQARFNYHNHFRVIRQLSKPINTYKFIHFFLLLYYDFQISFLCPLNSFKAISLHRTTRYDQSQKL